MPTIDWPSDACLRPSSVSFSVVPARSSWSAVYTRQRTQVSHLADRLRVTLQLPPCTAAEAAAREAWINYLVAESPWVRLRHFARPYPRGNARGTLTVGANAAAGVRSVTLSGARASPNLLASAAFEIDSDADGVADGWSTYISNFLSTGRAWSLPAGSLLAGDGAKTQAVQCSALGTDTLGIVRIDQTVQAGAAYTFSIYASADRAATATLYIGWYQSDNTTFISQSATSAAMNTTAQRYTLTATAPAGAGRAWLYAWFSGATGANPIAYFDAAQFELGSVASPWSGFARLLPGDTLSVGGNLLLVGYAGAVANDAGSMTVPLQLPLRTAVTAGAAVTWAQPTGTFQLETDAVSLEYLPGNLQSGFELSFLEVV